MSELTETQKQAQRKLIDALRSGRYKQCHRHLRNGDEFCALGVVYDVYDPQGWITGETLREHSAQSRDDLDEMVEHFGLSEDQLYTMVIRNDWLGQDFNQIADYLEWGWDRKGTQKGTQGLEPK